MFSLSPSRPPIDASHRGRLQFVAGGSGVADKLSYGRLSAAGSPEWVDVVPSIGGGGGSLVGTAANLNIMLDGVGSTLAPGVAGDVQIPSGFTITGWDLVADQVGSLTLDVWRDTYGVFPPTIADTITGTEKPRLTSEVKNQDLALTTWSTALAAEQWLRVNVDTAVNVTRATLTLRMVRT